ncbi:MAG: hypothetical protein AAF601_16785, partial [Pseudomonadota bacterium]
AILLNILHYVYSDPDKHIREWLTAIGALVGGITGITAAANDPSIEASPLLFGGVLAFIGAGLGQFAATALSILAFLVLFLSQGPVGMVIRTAILNSN